MPQLLLVASIILLIYCSHRIADRLARDRADYFFIAVAIAALQIGTLALLLSPFDGLTPICWVGAQTIVILPLALAISRFVPAVRDARPLRPFPQCISIFNCSNGARLIAALIALVMAITVAKQAFLPISNVDDRNYHASRTAYWMQHHNLLPWVTHNDRQVVAPLGGELIFFWPTMITRSELPGLFVFWFSYPFSAIAVFLILRELGHTNLASATGSLVLCFTPMILLHTRGVNPESWMMFFVLGFGFWMTRALADPRPVPFLFVGLYAALAFNARATALPVLLLAPFVPLIFPTPSSRRRASGIIVGGAVLGLLAGGSIVVYGVNLARFHHPLGPKPFRDVHMSDLSAQQVRTHAARAFVALLEPPFAPGESTRQQLAGAYSRMLDAFAAGAPLPKEDEPWPGPYHVTIKPFAENYSLPGLLWLPALVAAAMYLGKHRGVHDRQIAALAIVAAVLIAAVVFRIRWMSGMGRFWIAPFALAVPLIVNLGHRAASHSRFIRGTCIVILAISVCSALCFTAIDTYRALSEPLSAVGLDEPFFEPLAHIPDGSKILLLDGQSSRDYPLFRPRDGFANQVVSWGKAAFDASWFSRYIQAEHPSHVLVQDDRELDFHWDPAVASAPFVAALAAHPDFREIPLPYTPHMRLFARRDVPDPLR
jgi:hypothetical protein